MMSAGAEDQYVEETRRDGTVRRRGVGGGNGED